MTTVYNIMVDLVDFMGGFFEYVFVPPFLREYDIQYQNETKALEKRQIIERIEKAIEQLTVFIAQAQQNVKTGTAKLAAVDDDIRATEAKLAECALEGKSVREADRLRMAVENLKHEYKTLSTVSNNQSTIISTNQITLTQLKSNHTLLSGTDIDSSLLLSKDSLVGLLSTIRTKSNAQSLQHTIQVLGSLYLTGDAVTDENVRLRSAAYDA